MKVLLISPVPPKSDWPRGPFRSYWVPTGLAFLGRALQRDGHDVRVLVREEGLIRGGMDWAGEDARLVRLLEEYRPEMVGLSLCTPQVPEAGRIARLVRRHVGDHVLVVLGGPHTTALPERTLQECPSADVAVLGEAEETLVELARRGPSAEVPGLVFRDGDGFVRTAARAPVKDLDRLGPPAYDLFDMDFYTRPNRWLIRWLKLPVTNLRTSRGCTNRCTFCAGHLVAGLGLRFHSLDYVIDQMRHVADRYGVRAVLFEDDTLGADRERLLALAGSIRAVGLDRRLEWSCCLRVDQVDRELLDALKAAGCIQIEYGFESGSDSALKSIGKNTSVELNRRAVRLTREAGLRIFADVMVGLPGETERDVRETIAFLRWARPEVISPGRLAPLPGTAVYRNLTDAQRASLTWGGFTYINRPGFKVNLTAMDDETFERLYRRFMKYVFLPQMAWAMLRDTPPGEAGERRSLRRKLARFVLRHPLRAARVPW